MTSMMHNVMKETRIKSMITENVDEDDGTYEPFAAIFREEGKDESAFEATENYVGECFSRHDDGKTVNGRPYVLYNDMTKRVEFLYIKKKYRAKNTEAWQWQAEETLKPKSRKVGGENVGAGGSVAAGSVTGGASVAGNKASSSAGAMAKVIKKPRSEQDGDKGTTVIKSQIGDNNDGATEQNGDKRQDGDQGHSKPDGDKATPKKNGEDDGKEDDEKKILGFVNRAKTAKVTMLTRMAEAGDLVNSVATQKEWAWADTEDAIGRLKTIVDEMAAFKSCSKFWKDWVIADHKKFSGWCKNKYHPSVALAELQRVEKVEQLIKKLTKHMDMMKSMHQIKQENCEWGSPQK